MNDLTNRAGVVSLVMASVIAFSGAGYVNASLPTSAPVPVTSGNHRPATPIITEPAYDGRVVNAEDVHMETAPFSDEDALQTHVCSDWEIWSVSPPERVWSCQCIGGIARLHVHLGAGVFEGSHAGRRDLFYNTEYRLRTRHRDSSNDPATEWSEWAERSFSTAPAGTPTPLILEDIAVPPEPTWMDDAGQPVDLPAGAPPAMVTLGSAAGDILLQIQGRAAAGNRVMDWAPLANHVNMRVQIDAGGADLELRSSTLRFLAGDCRYVTVFLPEVHLSAGSSAYYWVAVSGATYDATPGQTDPVFDHLAAGSQVSWLAMQPDFIVEPFVSGFQLPVTIAFVPNPGPNPDDPFFYVTEFYGTIKMVTRSGQVSTYVTDLLNFTNTGDFPGEGLTGLVVEPETGDLIATLMYSGDPGNPNAQRWPKIMRFHSTDGGRTAATQTTILSMRGEPQGRGHQISTVTIGPDGKLYVHMGDGYNGIAAQSLDSFRGKVLRMNLDGTAPEDNPWHNGEPISARDYLYTTAMRNPFGGAWRAADNELYAVENGPTVDRFTKIVAGRDYGWDGSDESMENFAIHNWSPPAAPVHIAFIQPSTFGGSGFPASKYDHAFITESGPVYGNGPNYAKRITEFVLDKEGNLVEGPIPFVQYIGKGRGTAAALAAGPDGLYFSDMYQDRGGSGPDDPGSTIWRIRYVAVTDCNKNGAPDWCDIAQRTSQDANNNGVPDECEPCPADWDGSGTVTSQDFFLFIADFFAENADFNGDGMTNSVDFFEFLAVFFTACER